MSEVSPLEDAKAEFFRLTNPRWHLYRAVHLRDMGYSWPQIGEAMRRHFTTVQKYYKDGRKELEYEDSLHFWLTDRTRKLMLNYGFDTIGICAVDEALLVVRSYFEKKKLKGVGPCTALELLEAIDNLYECRANRSALAGVGHAGAARAGQFHQGDGHDPRTDGPGKEEARDDGQARAVARDRATVA